MQKLESQYTNEGTNISKQMHNVIEADNRIPLSSFWVDSPELCELIRSHGLLGLYAVQRRVNRVAMPVPRPRTHLSTKLDSCLRGASGILEFWVGGSIVELGSELLDVHVGAEEVVLGAAQLLEAAGWAVERVLEQIQVVGDPELDFGLGSTVVGAPERKAGTWVRKRRRHAWPLRGLRARARIRFRVRRILHFYSTLELPAVCCLLSASLFSLSSCPKLVVLTVSVLHSSRLSWMDVYDRKLRNRVTRRRFCVDRPRLDSQLRLWIGL